LDQKWTLNTGVIRIYLSSISSNLNSVDSSPALACSLDIQVCFDAFSFLCVYM